MNHRKNEEKIDWNMRNLSNTFQRPDFRILSDANGDDKNGIE